MNDQTIALITVCAIALFILVGLALQVYGVLVSFSKKWYFGLLSLLIPGFAMVVGGAKVLGKDILK